jgi:hypothetical protein
MPEKPFPLTGENTDQLVAALMRIIDELFTNTIGAAQVGDVFTINASDDVLTLTVSDSGGLQKSSKALKIKLDATAPGLVLSTGGLAVKVRASYGLTLDANGLALQKQTHEANASAAHTITAPADTPATADALRDDLVTNTIPSIEAALNALGTKYNNLLTKLETAEILASS